MTEFWIVLAIIVGAIVLAVIQTPDYGISESWKKYHEQKRKSLRNKR